MLSLKSQSIVQAPVFACKVKKFKDGGDTQKRHILVTTHAVYNFKPADTFRVYPAARRVIPLRELCAVIVSSSSEQMVLGCTTECVRIFLACPGLSSVSGLKFFADLFLDSPALIFFNRVCVACVGQV